MTLRDAIQSIGDVDTIGEKKDFKNSVFSQRRSVNRIMKSFLKAANDYETVERHAVKNLVDASCESKTKSTDSGSAVMMRGKLDHYNMRNGRWRIVVKDVELMTRPKMMRLRPHRKKPSLWKVAKRSSDVSHLHVDGCLQVLAHGDIE